MTLTTLLSSSIEGLMGLREEQPVSLSFKGLELSDERSLFKWEWFSEPLDCPPNERCRPEPMVGTMSPLEGNPRPFQGGEEVSHIVRREKERFKLVFAITSVITNVKNLFFRAFYF